MPRKVGVGSKAWKVVDSVACKTAGAAFDAIQFFNKHNPNPNFTPKWSDKPLLKSWEKSKPTLVGRDRQIRCAQDASKTHAKPSSAGKKIGAT